MTVRTPYEPLFRLTLDHEAQWAADHSINGHLANPSRVMFEGARSPRWMLE